MTKEIIKVLLVDDSPFTLDYIRELIDKEDEIEIIDTANNGKEAVEKNIKLSPDVIVMDIEMPIMSGIEATKKIMEEKPVPIIILTSSLNTRNLYKSFDAIKYGALEILNKPTKRPTEDWEETVKTLLTTIKKVANIKVTKKIKREEKEVKIKKDDNDFSIISINSSTGGPSALNTIFSNLKKDYKIPIVVAQHISIGFTQGLVDWLNLYSPLKAKIAEEGESIEGGNIYFPPDGAHLTVKNDKIKLLYAPPIKGIRPSGNILLESVANNFGDETIGIILTGMGHDGLNGAKKIKELGGCVIAQELSSTIVSSMPSNIIKNNLADSILTPIEIAKTLLKIEEKKYENIISR